MIQGGRYNIGSPESFGPGEIRAVNAGGEIVAVANVDGEFYAVADTCTHAEASLSEGDLDGHTIACPLHGAEFDVKTGEVLALPATSPIETFPVDIENGNLIVTIP